MKISVSVQGLGKGWCGLGNYKANLAREGVSKFVRCPR